MLGLFSNGTSCGLGLKFLTATAVCADPDLYCAFGALGASWGAHGVPRGRACVHLGRPGSAQGCIWSVQEFAGVHIWRPGRTLGCIWDALGGHWDAYGAPWEHAVVHMGCPGSPLGRTWGAGVARWGAHVLRHGKY